MEETAPGRRETGVNPCIYCARDASAPHVHHTVARAAGNSIEFRRLLGEETLAPGLACIGCNAYFGKDLDPALARHPFILQWRAVHGMRSHAKAKRPVYEDSHVRIEMSPGGVLGVSGPGVSLDRRGHLQVPRPSLDKVNHFFVSRAVHRAALENELNRITRKRGVEAAREAAGQPPLAPVAKYVRFADPRRGEYRAYGVEGQGGTGVRLSPFDFTVDPRSPLVSPPAFTGYIIPMPGARFSCTLAEDVEMLAYMLKHMERTEASAYLTTRLVFWSPTSGGIVTYS